jgi:hypothetical protein
MLRLGLRKHLLHLALKNFCICQVTIFFKAKEMKWLMLPYVDQSVRATITSASTVSSANRESTSVPKRGRGRPRKYAVGQPGDGNAEIESSSDHSECSATHRGTLKRKLHVAGQEQNSYYKFFNVATVKCKFMLKTQETMLLKALPTQKDQSNRWEWRGREADRKSLWLLLSSMESKNETPAPTTLKCVLPKEGVVGQKKETTLKCVLPKEGVVGQKKEVILQFHPQVLKSTNQNASLLATMTQLSRSTSTECIAHCMHSMLDATTNSPAVNVEVRCHNYSWK